ncbi:hypothetical protein POSPLADRAFT_1136248 [Postia placenta MAD-698-R-SB12]|uniref:Uncharacterized protein n=1 Tax=Postia placenta MAD-698-R-SB12 TaxID=670580 RepID=A0A1X6N9V3_9APHY|nr:hypothetical protein POSPLADRAFT_1136248 [Postia placenta MAD-698-R-SB12]OSX65429.1 hypothetical protein POSPLADRAFT_1136248 [Postia placenta MAD-698-R-SB12]
MAQLLQPAAPDPGRISQILPAVKCSSCAQPVPIAELGDHICQPGSPVPSLAGKPLVSPLTALELDPAKHQSRVAFPVKTIQAQQPPASDLIPTTPTNIPPTAPQVVCRLSGGRPISGQVDTKTGGEAGMAGVGMEPPKTPLSATPTTPSAASIRLPFFEKFKDSKLRSELQPEDNLDTTAPDSDAESDYGGLAYARSSADEDEDEDKPLKTKLPPISTSVTPASDSDHKDKVRFPSIAGSESHYSESPVSPRLPQRSLSASTGTSTYSARTIAKSTGALDRVMETLLEDVVSPSTSAAASPAPLTAPLLPENQRDSRPPKLPTRSHTSPTLGTGRVEQARGKKRVKERVCAKCTKIIDDGRWIQMEGGSVLCDKCWKSMYLPKVRAAVCLVPGCETDDVVVGDSAGDAA